MSEYSDLRTKIIDFLESNTTVISTTVFDYILENAQFKIAREFDLNFLRKVEESKLTSTNPYVNLPMNMLVLRSIQYLDAEKNRIFLEPKEVTYVIEYGKNRTSTAKPKYYAHWNEDTLLLSPTPNSDYSIEVHYTVKPNSDDANTLLNNSNPYSWISKNAPEVLFNVCMIEAIDYLKGPTDLRQIYEQRYVNSAQGLSIEQQGRNRRDEFKHGIARTPLQVKKP